MSLCQKFKEEIGDTIIEFTTKYRVSVAMRLLCEQKRVDKYKLYLRGKYHKKRS